MCISIFVCKIYFKILIIIIYFNKYSHISIHNNTHSVLLNMLILIQYHNIILYRLYRMVYFCVIQFKNIFQLHNCSIFIDIYLFTSFLLMNG